ncbi:hypothetical protein L6R52_24390, partial [Myxococcota bacterium]|nr:hypothetical protein [Myxococcota bacterium]
RTAPRAVPDETTRQAAIDRATAAVQGEGDIEAIEEIDLDEIPADKAVAQTTDARAATAAKVADQAAAPIAAAVQAIVPGLAHDELVRIAREVIERVAWEVVPDLAEIIIKAELDRLTRE